MVIIYAIYEIQKKFKHLNLFFPLFVFTFNHHTSAVMCLGVGLLMSVRLKIFHISQCFRKGRFCSLSWAVFASVASLTLCFLD